MVKGSRPFGLGLRVGDWEVRVLGFRFFGVKEFWDLGYLGHMVRGLGLWGFGV